MGKKYINIFSNKDVVYYANKHYNVLCNNRGIIMYDSKKDLTISANFDDGDKALTLPILGLKVNIVSTSKGRSKIFKRYSGLTASIPVNDGTINDITADIVKVTKLKLLNQCNDTMKICTVFSNDNSVSIARCYLDYSLIIFDKEDVKDNVFTNRSWGNIGKTMFYVVDHSLTSLKILHMNYISDEGIHINVNDNRKESELILNKNEIILYTYDENLEFKFRYCGMVKILTEVTQKVVDDISS